MEVCEEFERLMEFVDRVKQEAAYVAERVARGYNIQLIQRAREVWGVVQTIRREPVPVREISLKRLLLSAWIAESWLLAGCRREFIHSAVAIIGQGGAGKTTYAILSVIGAALLMGWDWGYAKEFVKEVMVVTPDEILNKLRWIAEERRWLPVLLIDDIGAQISKYWAWLGETWWSNVFSLMDQLKEFIGVLVLTARSLESIPKRLREIVDWVVEAKVTRFRENDVLLTVLYWYSAEEYLTKGYRRRKRARVSFVDVFLPGARMPDDVWRRLVDIRIETARRRLARAIEERNKVLEGG